MVRYSGILAYRERGRHQDTGDISVDWKNWKDLECNNR